MRQQKVAGTAALPRVLISLLFLVIDTLFETESARSAPSDFASFSCSFFYLENADLGKIYRGEPATGILRVHVTCPAGATFTIALPQLTGCAQARSIRSLGSYLNYVVKTPGQTGVWCDGSAGTATVKGLGTGRDQEFDGVIVVISKEIGAQHAGHFDGLIQGQLSINNSS